MNRLSRYYDFQTVVHTWSGTHATRIEEDEDGHKKTIDLGYEEDYKVSKANDGHWECSCKSWIFGRKNLYNGKRYSDRELEIEGITPNGICKHAQWVIENRQEIKDAIKSGKPQRVQSGEFYADIGPGVGRMEGFMDSL